MDGNINSPEHMTYGKIESNASDAYTQWRAMKEELQFISLLDSYICIQEILLMSCPNKHVIRKSRDYLYGKR